jgi:hypothetical protein
MTHALQTFPVWCAVLYRSASRFFGRKTLAFLGRTFGVRVFEKSVESNRTLGTVPETSASMFSPFRTRARVSYGANKQRSF